MEATLLWNMEQQWTFHRPIPPISHLPTHFGKSIQLPILVVTYLPLNYRL